SVHAHLTLRSELELELLEQAEDPWLVLDVRSTAIQQVPRHRTVHRTGIEVREAEPPRQLPRHRALPGTRRSIDRDHVPDRRVAVVHLAGGLVGYRHVAIARC